jgi:alkylhydroperoxidase family enzyme
MPRIRPVDPEGATPEQRAAHDAIVRDHGRMTNMKSTLLHSMPAFHALMEWYTLRDVVRPFLGDRLVTLFSHAISAETACMICSTFFRRILIDSGENPDELTLDAREQIVVDFGRCLSKPFARVPDELFARLAAEFSEEQIVALTAFGAMMVATNVLNNALDIDLDGYLEPYRAQATPSTSSGSPSTGSG